MDFELAFEGTHLDSNLTFDPIVALDFRIGGRTNESYLKSLFVRITYRKEWHNFERHSAELERLAQVTLKKDYSTATPLQARVRRL
jgi:hypothetical protein